MTDIEWATPPPDGRETKSGGEFAEALRANPGEWARIQKDTPLQAGSHARLIRMGGIKAFQPAGSFEAVSRGAHIYARYVGES